VKIRLFVTPARAARALAADLGRTIAANPEVVLGLPTGRTPIPLYRELAACCRARRLDLSRVTTFNLDEFVGVPAGDRRSYRAFMRRHLFDHVNADPARTHFLNGMAPDAEEECRRYERAIRRAGGLDVVVLGLGANGHIGFNEPGKFLIARTHLARLTPSTRRANLALFDGRARAVPRAALTMGVGTILGARRIVLLATGRAKATLIDRMVAGPVSPRLPASFLQLHAGAEIWLDRAAAARLVIRP
jgi:glucosamine-6-phosphate deaminase